jgi:hypothetical protein
MPHPEMSLYLPDCTMGGINGAVFSIKGKDLSKKMNLGGAKEYEFRARTEKDAQTWWNVVREVVTGQAASAGDLQGIAGAPPQRVTSGSHAMAGATGAMGGENQAPGTLAGSEQPSAGAGYPSASEQGASTAGGYGGMGGNPYTGHT